MRNAKLMANASCVIYCTQTTTATTIVIWGIFLPNLHCHSNDFITLFFK